ncbi:MAG: SAM-dependent methyltransferase [Bacteroides sp.]|nr:SAM-dependent methyltransferase [Bacteroides sp.]MDD2645005.1 SAM-dependent methyltransferase [Bacteroides sp.]MDD4054793.1 SAM-dependent methyltransferase [Bacteroides sp.]MDD4719324.1 SAM-dependent methyltransferase [Bacteroides sp.]
MLPTGLYLIPVTLGDTPIERVLPDYNQSVILQIKHFIVEDLRTARRFLKKVDRSIEINDLTFYVLNKRTPKNKLYDFLAPLQKGEAVGLMSEAGCPAVADPGSDMVALAHQRDIKVIPLVGPSSILLSLMASGFNGQSFTFHGYLPIQGDQRTQKIKELERRIYSDNETQLFIETPYRNQQMVDDLLKSCKPQTKLCVAANITCENEFILTKSIQEWKKNPPQMAKIPCIFLLYK